MSFLQLRSLSSGNPRPRQPVVTTQAASSVTATTADGNGTVVSDRIDSVVTARGFVYSLTNSVPNIINDTVVSVGSGLGAFTTTISSLSSTTLYYIRAYATNADGTSYGEVVTFTTSSAGGAVYINSKMLMGMGM